MHLGAICNGAGSLAAAFRPLIGGHSATVIYLSSSQQQTDPPPAPKQTDPPPAPSNLTSTLNSDGSIMLTWTAPDDDSVTGYQILRRRPRMGEASLLVYVNDTGSAATSYTDPSTSDDTLYVYRVKARSSAGLSGWSNYVNVDK